MKFHSDLKSRKDYDFACQWLNEFSAALCDGISIMSVEYHLALLHHRQDFGGGVGGLYDFIPI